MSVTKLPVSLVIKFTQTDLQLHLKILTKNELTLSAAFSERERAVGGIGKCFCLLDILFMRMSVHHYAAASRTN